MMTTLTPSGPSTDATIFALATFISALVLLEYGADAFVTHTAIVSRRLRIPQVLIALLTAGCEWEELAVIVASLIQHKPSLALGNVLGSAISNILGAFSIGLLCQAGVTRFDNGSKLYSGILFVVTTGVAVLAYCHALGKIVAGILVGSFVVYLGLVCWSIYRGVLAAPEDSDSDTDSESADDDGNNDNEEAAPAGPTAGDTVGEHVSFIADESSLLLPQSSQPIRSLLYHVAKLFIGFLVLSLSGYILSHSSATLAASFGLSDTVFGATLLSLATTLPEKFVAAISGSRGQSGILVANTVGSNIFLLTLCLGIVLLGANDIQEVRLIELAWVWGSALVLGLVVLLGSRRWIGAGLLLAYIVFLVLEFWLFRN